MIQSLHLLDYILIIIISITIIFSFFKGFIQSLLGLLTWVGAVIITLIFYENFANFISSYLNKINFLEESGLSIIISTILSIPFIFLVSLIILKKARNMISADFQKSSLGSIIDRLFGIVYGFIFGLLVISISLITINNISKGFSSSAFVKNSILYPYIDELNSNYIMKYIPVLIDETNSTIENNSDNK